MTPLAFVPVLTSVAGALASGAAARTLDPRRAAGTLSAVAVAAAGSTTAALLFVVVAAAGGHRPGAGGGGPWLWTLLVGWCDELVDRRLPVWAAPVAVAVLAVAAGRVLASSRRWQAAMHPWRGAAPVTVVPGGDTSAFAVPGRPGCVVIGQGLLDLLDPEERQVVLAHERAHLDHAHHRYRRTAEAAAAAFPFLVPLASRVRFATERWADEVAAEVVGDRRLVARTIAKAALAGSGGSVPLPAVSSGPVLARVEALLGPRPDPGRPVAAGLARTCVLVSVLAAAVQVHHLALLVAHSGAVAP